MWRAWSCWAFGKPTRPENEQVLETGFGSSTLPNSSSMESEQVMAPGQSGKLCVPSGIEIVTLALLQSVFVVGFDRPPWNQDAFAYGSVFV